MQKTLNLSMAKLLAMPHLLMSELIRLIYEMCWNKSRIYSQNLLCLRVSLKATASATTTLIRVTPFIRVYSCKSVYVPQAKALATNPCTKRLLQTNQFRSSPYSIVVLIFYLIIISVLRGARNGSTAPT